jgi:hypothetical protein
MFNNQCSIINFKCKIHNVLLNTTSYLLNSKKIIIKHSVFKLSIGY